MYKLSKIRLYKNEMNRYDSNEHDTQDKEKVIRSQLDTNNYRKLRKTVNIRCGFSQERAHKLFVSYHACQNN